MTKAFSRVELLIGKEKTQKLKESKVAIFGIGGVGGYTAEALVRSGIGNIVLIDSDKIDESNLNRQIIATVNNIGKDKVDVMKDRLLSINPELKVETIKTFYLPENGDSVEFNGLSYVVDAVDTVSAKLEIVERARKQGVPVITCLGTGGKLNPLNLKVSEIEKTNVCPLAKVMRRELKKRLITGVKAVWSDEEPIKTPCVEENQKKADGKTAPPSMIFVPAVAGIIIAREVVCDIIKE